MSLDDDILRACAEVGAIEKSVPKTGFHVELEEALWLMYDGKSLAEIVGDFRRNFVKLAIKNTGSRREAKKALKISNTSIYRIEQHGNKY